MTPRWKGMMVLTGVALAGLSNAVDLAGVAVDPKTRVESQDLALDGAG